MGMWVRDIRAVMAGEHNGRIGSRVLPGVAGGQNGLIWSGSPLHPQRTAHPMRLTLCIRIAVPASTALRFACAALSTLDLRILPALPCYVLQVEVNVYLQTGVLQELQHHIRHQQFVPLVVPEFVIAVIRLR